MTGRPHRPVSLDTRQRVAHWLTTHSEPATTPGGEPVLVTRETARDVAAGCHIHQVTATIAMEHLAASGWISGPMRLPGSGQLPARWIWCAQHLADTEEPEE